MTIAGILQSNYIPWKGYFDIINDCDIVIFLDDVQFTKQDWRSRNVIMSKAGPQIMTVPTGPSISRRICDVNLSHNKWQEKHFKTIQQNYGRHPYYRQYSEMLEEIYLAHRWKKLHELNQFIITRICKEIGIHTEFLNSYDLGGADLRKTDRLVHLLLKVNANRYVSGPAAKAYIQEDKFEYNSISLMYKTYGPYKPYEQLNTKHFIDQVSVLDVLFNVGPSSMDHIAS